MSTTTIQKKEYAKKYVRLENPPDFQITPLVLLINAEICRRPLIRLDQLFDLFPEISRRTVYDIIFLLFHNGFIARPTDKYGNPLPTIMTKSTYLNAEWLGISLHYAFFADPVPAPKYTQESKYDWDYMKHKHNETTSLLKFQEGARLRGGVSFANEAELWTRYAPSEHLNHPAYDINNFNKLTAHEFIANPPEPTSKMPKVSLKLSARFDWGVYLPMLEDDAGDDQSKQFMEKELTTVTLPLSVETDGYYSDRIDGEPESFHYHEEDEGTETILPSEAIRHSVEAFKGNSLFAKYAAYIATYRKRVHQKKFGIMRFDVTTHTTTPERVDLIIKKLAPIFLRQPFNIHPDFLKFTDRQTLANHFYNPYHPKLRYKNLAGEEVQLIPEPANGNPLKSTRPIRYYSPMKSLMKKKGRFCRGFARRKIERMPNGRCKSCTSGGRPNVTKQGDPLDFTVSDAFLRALMKQKQSERNKY